ncbi:MULTISPECIES: hypothetical protein [unclassified Pseudoalteromonas]|uniref:hypothetical protein n=1 Tax=unclassified Pseudoalteromonas TaxID=194690 RepID=UPI000CF63D80|nr:MULTISPECIES: hypothetical protein [unclassified Pseudoalteromonas]MBS3797815.1 hypothetical protein [Pseudoalteromonas sp. BDTF-M6]
MLIYMILLLIIAALAFGLGLRAQRRQGRQLSQLQQQCQTANQQTQAMTEQIAHLKERIQVLEAIVTDKGFSVEQEIDNL